MRLTIYIATTTLYTSLHFTHLYTLHFTHTSISTSISTSLHYWLSGRYSFSDPSPLVGGGGCVGVGGVGCVGGGGQLIIF